jgi:hypothetical protein
MHKLALGWISAALLLGVPGAASAHGWRHGHHHGHHRGGWGWGWWGPRVVVGVAPPYWYGAPPYPYAYPYPPPVVVREAPEVYVERPSPPVEGYWYYCESAEGYYPKVPSCPEPWIKVPPTPESE